MGEYRDLIWTELVCSKVSQLPPLNLPDARTGRAMELSRC